jgi:AraC-like DNA-binding protein
MEELRRKPYKRLSREELVEAARLHGEGAPVSLLAQQFQISERQLHRVLKNQANASILPPDVRDAAPARARRVQPFLQEFHSAWIYEELLSDPHITLDHIASGLRSYFNLDVSNSTIWRHIRGGTLEHHGFPGYTRLNADQRDDERLTV